MKDRRTIVLDVIREAPHPVSAMDIARQMGGRITAREVGGILGALKKEGKVTNISTTGNRNRWEVVE